MKSNVVSLLQQYEDRPILRGLVQLVPAGIGSAVETTLMAKLAVYEEQRLRTFFEELGSGTIELTKDVVESEDFLHAFTATTTAARRTRQREKIRYLARLLRGSFDSSVVRSTDEYEELLAIVDDLSLRELQILALFAQAERAATFRGEENDLQRANAIWPGFESAVKERLRLSPEDLAPMLVRLQRSGCYVEIPGGYWDYTGGRGHLSRLYHRLEEVAGSAALDAV